MEGKDSSNRTEEYRQRVIASCESDIGPLEDGFQYFWIKDKGALSATALRIIADELDRLNASWDQSIQEGLNEWTGGGTVDAEGSPPWDE